MLSKAKDAAIFCLLIVSFSLLAINCSKPEVKIIVTPGKSIAGVEIGMSKERVMVILGNPRLAMSAVDIAKSGNSFASFLALSPNTSPKTKIFFFSNPSLYVVINENNKVIHLSLGSCPNLEVQGFPSIKYGYLSLPELDKIGLPTIIIRNKDSEKAILSTLPKGAQIEYYNFQYDKQGLILGLIFDKVRQKDGYEDFVKLNYIKVVYKSAPRG